MRFPLFTIMLVVFASISLLTSCSVSYSLGKSSDSISASLDSISTSSGNGDETAADVAANRYFEDVAVATERFVSKRENSRQFQQAISDIARNHGIVDWEREGSTYVAMGKGLRRAGVGEQMISAFPYFRIVANGTFYSLVLAGYHQSS